MLGLQTIACKYTIATKRRNSASSAIESGTRNHTLKLDCQTKIQLEEIIQIIRFL